jgi:branched-chain amino acid transport system ATP-binding protein
MLELRNIEAGYGSQRVLLGVSLSVPPGSVVALLGANGAGKTTLLRVASGLIRPTSGQLMVDGEDVTSSTPHELVSRGICHVPEGRGVFGGLTVRENLELQCRDGNVDAAIEGAVSVFPALGRRIGQMAGTMSGGEQQMLALARTYIQRPRVALLDEVSMGLAPVVVDQIFDFLQVLTAQGSSLLLVEQYVTRALGAADYVYLMHKGVVSFAGDPGELEGEDIFREYVGADIAAH